MPKYNITCDKYSDAFIVARGSDTIKFKDTFKEFGGSWSTHLKCGEGWLFLYSEKLLYKLQKFLEIIEIEIETKKDLSLDAIQPSIESYTDKSFIIIGNTRPYKDKIKELGGTWNAKLREGKKAWVFPETKRKDIQEWIDKEFDDLTFEEEFEPDLMPSNKKRLL